MHVSIYDRANKWLTEIGIRTSIRSNGSLMVSREDLSILGDSGSVLETLKEDLNTKKLFWNSNEETMGWLVLESF
jgi:hypothetical protein